MVIVKGVIPSAAFPLVLKTTLAEYLPRSDEHAIVLTPAVRKGHLDGTLHRTVYRTNDGCHADRDAAMNKIVHMAKQAANASNASSYPNFFYALLICDRTFHIANSKALSHSSTTIELIDRLVGDRR